MSRSTFYSKCAVDSFDETGCVRLNYTNFHKTGFGVLLRAFQYADFAGYEHLNTFGVCAFIKPNTHDKTNH